MKRECKKVRSLLLSGGSAETHLKDCPECSAFGERLRLYREGLAHRSIETRPDPGFAGRVRSRLVEPQSDALSWAAGRFLPAAVALVLVLAIWSFQTPSVLDSVAEATVEDDLLAWVIDEDPASSGDQP